MAHLKSETCDT